MKVREVILLLEALDPDAEVWVEGCDCVEPCGGVAAEGDTVMMERQDMVARRERDHDRKPPKTLEQIEREAGIT